MRHVASRGLLVALSGFIAVSAIAGALFVVPGLPEAWIAGSVFEDYTIPALGLGLVGGLALATFLMSIIRPELAGLLGAITGAGMVVFELVEIWAVGFSPLEYGLDQPYAWLQVVFLVVGGLTAAAGVALWSATRADRASATRRASMPGVA